MNILHIGSSISGAASVSPRLSIAAVAEIAGARPETNVVYRDLVAARLCNRPILRAGDLT